MDVDVSSVVSLGSVMSDMSVLGLFDQSDIVVKAVIMLLAVASFFSWAVIFEKTFVISRQFSKAKKFEHTFWSGQVIERLYEDFKNRDGGGLAKVFVAGMKEYNVCMTKGGTIDQRSIDNVSSAMKVEISRVLENCEKNVDYLATIGSIAPFVGLFGTVWGIMSSFQSIAVAKSATLAVVAPSIAEALLATALGLIVAVPAVLFYNHIANNINKFSIRAENFATELLILLSKEVK